MDEREMSVIERWRHGLSQNQIQPRLWVLYGRDTARYIVASSLPDDEALEIKNPLAGHYLNELALEGRVQQNGKTYGLSWDAIYQLLADKEQTKALSVLELPPLGKPETVTTERKYSRRQWFRDCH